MNNVIDVRWEEMRTDERGYRELFYISAVITPTEWKFYQVSTWSTRWDLIPSSEALIKQAIIEVNKRIEPKSNAIKL